MTNPHTDDNVASLASITGPHRRILEAIFHHPSAHNLEWDDVVGLIGHIGDVHERADNEFVFKVGSQRHVMRKAHTQYLTGDKVLELRHFLGDAGWAPGHPS